MQGPRKGFQGMSGDLTVAGCTRPGSREEVAVGPRGPDPHPEQQSEHNHRARRRRKAPVLKHSPCVQKANPVKEGSRKGLSSGAENGQQPPVLCSGGEEGDCHAVGEELLLLDALLLQVRLDLSQGL